MSIWVCKTVQSIEIGLYLGLQLVLTPGICLSGSVRQYSQLRSVSIQVYSQYIENWDMSIWVCKTVQSIEIDLYLGLQLVQRTGICLSGSVRQQSIEIGLYLGLQLVQRTGICLSGSVRQYSQLRSVSIQVYGQYRELGYVYLGL